MFLQIGCIEGKNFSFTNISCHSRFYLISKIGLLFLNRSNGRRNIETKMDRVGSDYSYRLRQFDLWKKEEKGKKKSDSSLLLLL